MPIRKILVVEDEAADMQELLGLLQGKGYDLSTAEDGEAALLKARSESPDLILLDVILPKKNGFQVCRMLKKDPANEDLKIILVTTKTQESDRFWGLKQGASDYLTKPIDESALDFAIAKLQ